MPRKLKRSKTPTDGERIKDLEKRLHAACQEHRRMREEIRALEARDPLADLREALNRQAAGQERRRRRSERPSLDATFNPDETVN